MVIRDTHFDKVADNVKPDAKKRLVLHKIAIEEGITYHIYRNRLGQIVLDPQVSIPAAEGWLFHNAEALESVQRGIADAGQGRVSKVKNDEL